MLGVWTTEYHGRQVVHNRPDRTARVEIDFDWLASLLYGSHIEMELKWNVENGFLTNVIQYGAPKKNVDRLIADYSNQCQYIVLEIAENELLLQEVLDPDAFHRWRRIK